MENQPLVSIVIITYNSSEYVLETLDSALEQTYPNIEIIISDDCSKDNTVSLCRNWIDEHASSGISSQLLESPQNTGTAANINRGLKVTKGEWVKCIAGDDLLLPSCIEDNIKYVNNHPEAKIVFSDFIVFSGIRGGYKRGKSDYKEKTDGFFKLDAEGQLKILLAHNILPATTSFFSGETIRMYGYNESYKYLEDAPLWIRLTSEGYRMYSFETPTVMYRHHESLSKTKKCFYSPLLFECNQQFFWQERLPLIRKYGLNEAYQYNRRKLFTRELVDIFFKNKKTRITNSLYKMVKKIVFRWVSFDFK